MEYLIDGNRRCHLSVYVDSTTQKMMVYLSGQRTDSASNQLKENGKRNYVIYTKKELLPFLGKDQLESFSLDSATFIVGEERVDIRFTTLVEGQHNKEHFIKNFKEDKFFSKRYHKSCFTR